MAKKEHLKRQNVRRVQDEPFDQEEIALELQKEFNNDYGTDNVSITDGKIVYNDTDEADKKDNDWKGL